MNYIRHLNAFFTRIKGDDRLTAMHVSLYLALFQYWNFNRFDNPFPVYRDNIMSLSKIGSKNTYHKCVRELHACGYILYHPAPSKYQPVKISMVRFDAAEPQGRLKQLDLFEMTGITAETQVPQLTATSTDNEPPHVPNLGQSVKQEKHFNKQVYNPPIMNKKNSGGEERRNATTPQVPLMRHVPTEEEVQTFFREHYYSADQAQRFFLYNNAKSWMLTDKVPIYDWQSLAHKWMLNVKAEEGEKLTVDLDRDIQYLYERFLEGGQVAKLIIPEFCDHLALELTESHKAEALRRRINQLSGSNERSEQLLWHAYMSEDWANPLLTTDSPNLLALTKRIAVHKHFINLKSRGADKVITK